MNLARKPYEPQYEDFRVILDLDLEVTVPSELEVLMTDNFQPRVTDLSDLAIFYECKLNKGDNCIPAQHSSAIWSKMWSQSRYTDRSTVPQGNDAIIWENYIDEAVTLVNFPSSGFPTQKSFSVTFWVAWIDSKAPVSIKLVALEGPNEEYIHISTGMTIPNSLKVDIKISEFERHYTTGAAAIQAFEWVHCTVTVNSDGDVQIFINGELVTGKYVDASRAVQFINVQSNANSIHSVSIWYDDGTRVVTPGETFGQNLQSDIAEISMTHKNKKITLKRQYKPFRKLFQLKYKQRYSCILLPFNALLKVVDKVI